MTLECQKASLDSAGCYISLRILTVPVTQSQLRTQTIMTTLSERVVSSSAVIYSAGACMHKPLLTPPTVFALSSSLMPADDLHTCIHRHFHHRRLYKSQTIDNGSFGEERLATAAVSHTRGLLSIYRRRRRRHRHGLDQDIRSERAEENSKSDCPTELS
jgi:hypothetical protein